MTAFEKVIKCSLTEMVPLPKNFGRCSLNFGRGVVVEVKFKGEGTCHG
jgi:hypothetical protein